MTKQRNSVFLDIMKSLLIPIVLLASVLTSCGSVGVNEGLNVTTRDNVQPSALTDPVSADWADIDEDALPVDVQSVILHLTPGDVLPDLVFASDEVLIQQEGGTALVLPLDADSTSQLLTDNVVTGLTTAASAAFPVVAPFAGIFLLLFKRFRRAGAAVVPGLRGPSGSRGIDVDEAMQQIASLVIDVPAKSDPAQFTKSV